VQNRFCWET